MAESFQNEVPKARINLKLDLHTGGANKKTELPLKLLVAGDFSNGKDASQISERKKVNLDKNNFDSVLSEYSPKVNFAVKNTLAGDGSEEKISLTFRSMQDFSPEQIARQIPQLKAMLSMRNLLRDLKANLLDIRVAKGLLVTADGKVHGEGDVLDRDVALREIEAVRTQIEGLATATRQAKALEADIASQQAMFSTRLKTLNEMLHFSAPEGMTFTSAEHLQLAAGKNIALNAGGDISIGTQGHITGLAGDSVGMFAQHGKLSLISAQGPVQFQAQNGMMYLNAEQKLTLISASEILLAGKKRIRLVGGGSSILIEQGQIKYETAGTYTRKASRLNTEGGASQAVKLPYLPGKGEYDLALNFFDGLDAIPKAPYTLHFDGGSELAGVLDEQGYALHKNVPFEPATVTYQLPPPEPEKPWAPWDLLLEKTSVREG